MLLIAGRTESSNPQSSPVPIRVKIYGHRPNENEMGNGTTPKLILLPNSLEDLFRVAGMSMKYELIDYIQNACIHIKCLPQMIMSGFMIE